MNRRHVAPRIGGEVGDIGRRTPYAAGSTRQGIGHREPWLKLGTLNQPANPLAYLNVMGF